MMSDRQDVTNEQAGAMAIQPKPVELLAAFQALSDLVTPKSGLQYFIICSFVDKPSDYAYQVCIGLKEATIDTYAVASDTVLPDAIWQAVGIAKGRFKKGKQDDSDKE